MTIIKESEDDLKKWKDIPCTSTGSIHIGKMPTLPKAIYRFNLTLVKLHDIFHRTRISLKFN